MPALVLAGTAKGLFLLRSDDRRGFEVEGPLFRGEEIYTCAADARSRPPRLFAGSVSMHWGPTIRTSPDGGKSWQEPDRASLAFPGEAGAAVQRIWQILPTADPDVVYAGVEPAALFRSDDGGATFSLVEGLWNHPHRQQWQPGGGGLCLHTILVDPRDPDRLLIAISAAGVYRSDDGGDTWEASNTGIRAVFLPDPDVEFGQCVHKMARDPIDPDRLYLQHHWGVYRSDDAGTKWVPVSKGLPTDFGFPVVAHPSKADTAYVIPLTSDEYRCTVEGRCRVYRTRDAGGSWESVSDGLPQENAHVTVLRDGFCSDGGDPAGLYFGTRGGEVFASADEGEHWFEAARHLPPVLTVKATVF